MKQMHMFYLASQHFGFWLATYMGENTSYRIRVDHFKQFVPWTIMRDNWSPLLENND